MYKQAIHLQLKILQNPAKKKFTETAHHMVDKVGETANQATEKASETYGHMKKVLNDAGHNLQEQTEHMYEAMAKYVRENPLKAVGIAAVAGCALAMVMRKLGD